MKKFKRSLAARVNKQLIFEHINSLTVYVEDKDDTGVYDKFYYILLNRVFPSISFRIEGVGGKSEVIKAQRLYSLNPVGKAIFIIDGDFELIHGSKEPPKGVYRLEKYCIENYLIDESAIVTVIDIHNTHLKDDQIRDKLGFNEWVSNNNDIALNLYKVFAVCDIKRVGKVKTAGRRIDDLCLNDAGDLCPNKVDTLINELKEKLNTIHAQHEIHSICEDINNHVEKHEYTFLDICSGKSLLLPLVYKRTQTLIGHECKDLNLFKQNLAKSCDLHDLMKLSELVS